MHRVKRVRGRPVRGAWIIAISGVWLIAACTDDDGPGAVRERAYACDQGVEITAIFNPVSRLVTIRRLGPEDVLLPARPAESGFSYATDRVQFRGEGDTARLSVDGASVDCRALPSG